MCFIEFFQTISLSRFAKIFAKKKKGNRPNKGLLIKEKKRLMPLKKALAGNINRPLGKINVNKWEGK